MLRYSWYPLLVAVLIAGCGKKDEIEIQKGFSINLARPVNSWPKRQNLTPAQKNIFETHGTPEFLHLWWAADGMIQTEDQVHRTLRSRQLNEIKNSWVYPQKNLEVIFDGPENYREIPIDDELQVLVQLGDPESMRVNTSYKEGLEEWWTYYSRGETIIFRDGKLFDRRRDFAPMGSYLRR